MAASSSSWSAVLGIRRINKGREEFSLGAAGHKPSAMTRRSWPTMMAVKRRTPADAVPMPTSYAATNMTLPFLSFSDALPRLDGKEKREEIGVAPEKLDGWLMDSIGEIVKNLSEAPFLMHLRCRSQEKSSSTPTMEMELEKEQASPETWPAVKRRWQHESHSPDAVILVEELNQTRMLPGEKEDGGDAASRTWGLLVQGRGLGIDSTICYVLSTTRVASLAGACTHFCLVRAKCFDEPYWLQLRNAWLHR